MSVRNVVLLQGDEKRIILHCNWLFYFDIVDSPVCILCSSGQGMTARHIDESIASSCCKSPTSGREVLLSKLVDERCRVLLSVKSFGVFSLKKEKKKRIDASRIF